MTTACITTALTEDRHHVQAKHRRTVLRRLGDLHWHGERAPAEFNLQGRLAIGKWQKCILVQFRKLGIGKGEFSLGRHVARGAIGVLRLHHQ